MRTDKQAELWEEEEVTHAGRESEWAKKKEAQQHREQRQLRLTNGGLNLHTPTIPVCKKINEV